MNNEIRNESQALPESIRCVGADDLTLSLFENQYPVQPMGVSYNSYLILDEKIAVMDSVDARAADEWLAKLAHELDGRSPDYLVIAHGAGPLRQILRLAEKYQEMQLTSATPKPSRCSASSSARTRRQTTACWRLARAGRSPRHTHASFYARPDGSMAGGDGRLRGNGEAPLLRRRLRALVPSPAPPAAPWAPQARRYCYTLSASTARRYRHC